MTTFKYNLTKTTLGILMFGVFLSANLNVRAQIAPVPCNADFQWFNECDTFVGMPDCNKMTIYFQDRSYGDPVEWYWHFGDGSTGEGRYVDHTYDSAGVYEVCLTIVTKTGCQSRTCKRVIVENPQPECEADFQWFNECDTFGTPGCDVMTIYFQDISYGNVVESYWDFGDGSTGEDKYVDHTYSSPGEYTVCHSIVTVTGCQSTICKVITVENPQDDCEAVFDISYTDSALLYLLSDISDEEVVSRQWFINGDSISSEKEFYYLFPHEGYYYICLAILTKNQCYDITCDTITITGQDDCEAMFEYYPLSPGSDSVNGDGYPYTFQDVSGFWVINRVWTFEGGDTIVGPANVVYTFPAPGTYTVCLTITTESGCTDTYCQDVIVFDTTKYCPAYFRYEPLIPFEDSAFCDGVIYRFTDLSGPGVVNRIWNFGGDTVVGPAEVVYTFPESGIYYVSLIITTESGCVDTSIMAIDVIDSTSLKAMFRYYEVNQPEYGDDSIYANYLVRFIDMSQGKDIDFWFWDFGDGTQAIGRDFTKQYNAPGRYYVCLTIQSVYACMDYYCQWIDVYGNEECDAYYEYCHYTLTVDSSVVDSTYIIGFKNKSAGNPDHYLWDFGDGTTSNEENPVHEYSNAGYYEVCLTIWTDDSNCYSVFCDTVNVGIVDCYADYIYGFAVPDCEEYEVAYYFEAIDFGDVASYTWDFGDGETSNEQNPFHIFGDTGFYNVCLEIVYSDSCAAGECKLIEVTQHELDSVYNSKCPHLGITDRFSDKGISVGNAYPVPASDKLYLEVSSDTERTISVSFVNILGSTIDIADNYALHAGDNQMILSLDKLETGTYIYLVTSSDQTLRGTISIVK